MTTYLTIMTNYLTDMTRI